TAKALVRLQSRIDPTGTGNTDFSKNQSSFGLGVSWKRSPDKLDSITRTKSRGFGGDVFGSRGGNGEKQSKVREVMRQLWFDEVDFSELTELGGGRVEADGYDAVVRRSGGMLNRIRS